MTDDPMALLTITQHRAFMHFAHTTHPGNFERWFGSRRPRRVASVVRGRYVMADMHYRYR